MRSLDVHHSCDFKIKLYAVISQMMVMSGQAMRKENVTLLAFLIFSTRVNAHFYKRLSQTVLRTLVGRER